MESSYKECSEKLLNYKERYGLFKKYYAFIALKKTWFISFVCFFPLYVFGSFFVLTCFSELNFGFKLIRYSLFFGFVLSMSFAVFFLLYFQFFSDAVKDNSTVTWIKNNALENSEWHELFNTDFNLNFILRDVFTGVFILSFFLALFQTIVELYIMK